MVLTLQNMSPEPVFTLLTLIQTDTLKTIPAFAIVAGKYKMRLRSVTLRDRIGWPLNANLKADCLWSATH